MKKILCIALVCVMAVAVLAGCGNGGTGSTEQDNPMIGKWEDPLNGDITEFKSDSTYTVVDKDGNPKDENENLTYEIEGDKLIIFNNGEKVDMDFSISGDEIVSGDYVILKRI